MIEVYLNFNGNAREAAHYYSAAFDGEKPYIMTGDAMPKDPSSEMELPADFVIYANVKTFAGDIMMSDSMPGRTVTGGDTVWITVSHTDEEKIRKAFNNLATDGEVIMPLEKSFFSPLYGQLKDKYGFLWMFMLPAFE